MSMINGVESCVEGVDYHIYFESDSDIENHIINTSDSEIELSEILLNRKIAFMQRQGIKMVDCSVLCDDDLVDNMAKKLAEGLCCEYNLGKLRPIPRIEVIRKLLLEGKYL